MSVRSSPFADLLPAAAGAGVEPHDAGAARPAVAAVSSWDALHLERALAEARRGVGRTAPNPPVGAVVARDDEVMATGFHARAGERHAEVVALDALPPGAARGATLYVTLEPCVHHGRTPPCVERIIAEGIARVVVGAVDPNPRVHHKGIAAMRAAGVTVELATGAAADACQALIAPFASVVTRGRPWVVLKVAASLDGRIATASGASRWITGARAREVVHGLRDAADVVMVGAGTVRADDPELTVRHPPSSIARAPRDPARVVIDGGLRTDPGARVYRSGAGAPTRVLCGRAPDDRVRLFDAAGIRPQSLPDAHGTAGHVDLAAAVATLAPSALAVLVEAGPGLATALLQGGLVDELWWFAAPCWLGADARPALGPLGLATPGDATRWRPLHRAMVGDDALTVLVPPADAGRVDGTGGTG